MTNSYEAYEARLAIARNSDPATARAAHSCKCHATIADLRETNKWLADEINYLRSQAQATAPSEEYQEVSDRARKLAETVFDLREEVKAAYEVGANYRADVTRAEQEIARLTAENAVLREDNQYLLKVAEEISLNSTIADVERLMAENAELRDTALFIMDEYVKRDVAVENIRNILGVGEATIEHPGLTAFRERLRKAEKDINETE